MLCPSHMFSDLFAARQCEVQRACGRFGQLSTVHLLAAGHPAAATGAVAAAADAHTTFELMLSAVMPGGVENVDC